MGEVIVITSGKGGVGKTTACAYIGAGLSNLGKKVILIDTDLGLRSLDVMIGQENFIINNLVDVILEKCSLEDALVKDNRYENLFLLPAAQTKDPFSVTPEQMKNLCQRLKEEFDYVILDSPPGVGRGLLNAAAGADQGIILVTPDVPSIRDADCVANILSRSGLRNLSFILNRYRQDLLIKEQMITLEDIQEVISIPLLGIVPEDDFILTGTFLECLADEKVSPAAKEFENISRRIQGEDIPLPNVEKKKGLFSRISHFLKNNTMNLE